MIISKTLQLLILFEFIYSLKIISYSIWEIINFLKEKKSVIHPITVSPTITAFSAHYFGPMYFSR